MSNDLSESAELKTEKTKLIRQKREATKRLNDTLSNHEELKAELQVKEVTLKVKLQSLEKEFAVKESKLISDIASLDDSLKEKNKEVDKVNSILEKAEEDYIKLDSKISVAKNNVLEEEARIDKVKEGFASWKVQVVEEVARMKLKGKMANIDKAGLKEIING